MASKISLAHSDSNASVASSGKTPKFQDTDTYNMLSDLLNAQSDRLEKQISDSKDLVLQTMEEKMDRILQESESRTNDRLERIEVITTEKLDHLGGRVAQLESRDTNQEVLENHIAAFSSTMNQQMDEITNRLDTNLVLMKENAANIAIAPTLNTMCPNEERITRVEGNCDQNGQDHRNFSLILTGMGPEHQNLNGILGFSHDMLGVYIDPNEVADVLKLGVNRQGRTVTKVVFYSVGTRLRLYQARTGLRAETMGFL